MKLFLSILFLAFGLQAQQQMFLNGHPVGTLPSGPTNNLYGLVAWYKFTDGTGQAVNGGTVTDSSGSGNTGTIFLQPFYTNVSLTPHVTTAMWFATSNTCVNVSDSSSLQLTTAGSISTWAFTPNFNNNQGMIAKGDIIAANTFAYGFGTPGAAGKLYACVANASFASVNSMAVPASAWVFLTMTWDGANIILYTNAVLCVSATSSQVSANSGKPLRLGANGATAQGYYWTSGLYLADVRIYNRALNSTELPNMYQY